MVANQEDLTCQNEVRPILAWGRYASKAGLSSLPGGRELAWKCQRRAHTSVLPHALSGPALPRRVIYYPPLPTIQTQSRRQQPALPLVFPVIIRRRTPPGGLSSTLSSLSSGQTNKPQSHSWPLEIWTAQRKSSEGSCALCDNVNSPQIGRGAGRRSDSKFGQMF